MCMCSINEYVKKQIITAAKMKLLLMRRGLSVIRYCSGRKMSDYTLVNIEKIFTFCSNAGSFSFHLSVADLRNGWN